MNSYISALGGLADIPQFLVWKLTWSAEENKYKKVPINVQSPEFPADGALKKNQLSITQAFEWSNYLNSINQNSSVRFTPGFYFDELTQNAGYFFLDIDAATVGNEWSEISKSIYTDLNGVAYEVSSSGRGMHFFGKAEISPGHGNKSKDTNLELYTRGRGAAFGFSGITGNADFKVSQQMQKIVDEHFSHSKIQITPLFTDFSTPDKDYFCSSGDNDDELIKRIINSEKSGRFAFDHSRATFEELYNADFKQLEKIYKHLDLSKFDSMLAHRLAFWTGRDAPRIERMMRASKMYRDKWDSHKTYLYERTIINACSECEEILQDKKPNVIALTSSDGKTEIDYLGVMGEKEQNELFDGITYVISENKFYIKEINDSFTVFNKESFEDKYGCGRSFLLNENQKYVSKAVEAYLKGEYFRGVKIDAAKFNPLAPPREIFLDKDGLKYLNTYAPIPIKKISGDPSKFLNLVHKNFPQGDDAEILLCWMAACVQYRGVKFKWSPVLQGGQGCGKGLMMECLRYSVGKQFTRDQTIEDFVGNFNEWIESALLVIIDEAKNVAGLDSALKRLLTESTISLRKKFADQKQVDVYANFIFAHNEKTDFKKRRGDRRLFVLYSDLQDEETVRESGLNFVDIVRWLEKENGLAIVAQYLTDYKINPKYNPAGNCIEAPKSSREDEVLESSKSRLQSTIEDAIDECVDGVRNGWICLSRLKDVILKPGNFTAQRIGKELINMGYVKHPGLDDGRTDSPLVREGGKKVRLYCTKEVAEKTATLSHKDIADAYEQAQCYFPQFDNSTKSNITPIRPPAQL